MIYKSFAKINLGLNVLQKRQDGFHEIQTIFYPVCLHDNLTIKPNNSIIVKCYPDLGITQEQNLVYKATKLLQKYVDNKFNGIEIEIRKNIPTGGGLGGGSSNAATVLKALNEIYELELTSSILKELSADLGSDIPFFIDSEPAFGSGKGELLEKITLDIPYHLLLVLNNINVSTSWAYKELKRTSEIPEEMNFRKIAKDINRNPKNLKQHLINDFEDIVFKKHPELKVIKESLYENGAVYAQMSGSGSTMFGFFDSIESLKTAKEKLNKFKTFTCPKV